MIRDDFDSVDTVSRVGVPGLNRTFHFLEDTVRENGEKVRGETAIPAGMYELVLRKEDSPMLQRWLRKDWVKRWGGLKYFIMLKDVPNFSYIYLHAGRDHEDSDGCLLTGMQRGQNSEGVSEVYNSRDGMEMIYDHIIPRLEAGERWFIDIKEAR